MDTFSEEPPSHLTVSISPHLRKISEHSQAIQKQFFPSDEEYNYSGQAMSDPLLEDEFTKTKGLVHKYKSRVLITLTMTCAAYCRFCTRRRIVSDIKKGQLTEQDVDRMVTYLKSDRTINEVIFSGGDPLTAPQLLIYALGKISKLAQIKIIRIHTRVPVSNPSLLTEDLLSSFRQITKQPLYISIHFEHPDEMTKPTLQAIRDLRSTGAILLSQSVFLKGINDSYPVLKKLFTKLAQIGIRPYYIYRCDPTKGVEHFIVPFEKELKIMTKLRANLSGIACPTYVIDSPGGAGKIPVPLNFWSFNHTSFIDFWGKKLPVSKPWTD